jgi:hypothetical protein
VITSHIAVESWESPQKAHKKKKADGDADAEADDTAEETEDTVKKIEHNSKNEMDMLKSLLLVRDN